jgi:hypothetical protein
LAFVRPAAAPGFAGRRGGGAAAGAGGEGCAPAVPAAGALGRCRGARLCLSFIVHGGCVLCEGSNHAMLRPHVGHWAYMQ